MSWKDYFNGQLYSECRLVAALNAYRYLTGRKYVSSNKCSDYERLVDLCHARNGAALNAGLHKVWRELGIRPVDHSNQFKVRLPLEVNVRHPDFGFHSVAVVGYEERDFVRVANFPLVANLDGWMSTGELLKWVVPCPDKTGWKFRTFVRS